MVYLHSHVHTEGTQTLYKHIGHYLLHSTPDVFVYAKNFWDYAYYAKYARDAKNIQDGQDEQDGQQWVVKGSFDNFCDILLSLSLKLGMGFSCGKTREELAIIGNTFPKCR